jgi:hypothetical protein
VVAGELITDVWCNTTMDDIAQALTESLDRGGRGGMLAPFRFSDGTIAQPGAAWALETGTGFSRTDVGTLNVSILGGLNMTWDQNGISLPAGKRISIVDAPVDPTDAVNLASLGMLPPTSTVGDGQGNQYEIGYRDIPRTNTNWERGKCWVITTGVTLTGVNMGEGYTYTLLNASGAAVSIAPGSGISLKVTGSNVSGTFSLAAYTMVTIWCESTTVARVAAVLPITSGDIIAALGFTPYDAANPAGYLNAITASQVITALGYNPVAPAGTFATGTWNISINGNAATATTVPGLARCVSPALPVPSGVTTVTSAISSGTAVGTVPNRAPDAFSASWRCLTAEQGYVPGDEVLITDADSSKLVVSATQWSLVYGVSALPTLQAFNNPGATFTITASSWALVFRGVWLP